jgi:hypothetical protein
LETGKAARFQGSDVLRRISLFFSTVGHGFDDILVKRRVSEAVLNCCIGPASEEVPRSDHGDAMRKTVRLYISLG